MLIDVLTILTIVLVSIQPLTGFAPFCLLAMVAILLKLSTQFSFYKGKYKNKTKVFLLASRSKQAD